MAKLECARCHASVPEEQGGLRCPRCGGELLAPPPLLQRPGLVTTVRVAGFVLMAVWLVVIAMPYFLVYVDRALAFFDLSPIRSGAAERQQQLRDRLRDAELTVPLYTGSSRLGERLADNRLGTAPVLEVCWRAPVSLPEVLDHYRGSLPAAAGGRWRVVRDSATSAQLAAEQGQVRLLVRGPGDESPIAGFRCPEETTYVLSFTPLN
ncbi:MAG TPA: hypothetical protein VHS99_09290 [Chloroflexota bacterium]|jgi:hypothetical protein|nr:hypothetical protein [Chloroflexota bacterium]